MAIFTILALLRAMLINPAWAGRGNGGDGGNGNRRDPLSSSPNFPGCKRSRCVEF
jgi:hypothetical protein